MTLETMSVATCYPLLGLFCEYPSATCIQTVSVTVCKTMFRSALGRSRQPRAAEEAFSFVLTSLCPILGACPCAVVNGGVRELLRSLAKTRYEDSEFRGREKYQARLIEKSTEAFQRVADFFPCPLRHYPAKFCTFAVLSALCFEPKIKKLQEMSGSKFQ